MTKYLLDTSAIRALKADQLKQCSNAVTLLASPFAFWELSSHLADPDQFGRIKANLMKFSFMTILNEPTAVAEQRIGLRKPFADIGEAEASDVIYAALAALRESDSLEEFYRCHIRDENGALRAIGGCVTRVYDMLSEAENGFIGFLGDIKRMIKDRKVVLVGAYDYHRGTLDLIDGWWHQVKQYTDCSEEAKNRVVRQGYLFYSYVMHRALEYAQNAREIADKNDLEDAKLLLHLSLDDDVTVVTEDKGLIRCVKEGLDTLKTVDQKWCSTNVSICCTKEFLEKVGVQS